MFIIMKTTMILLSLLSAIVGVSAHGAIVSVSVGDGAKQKGLLPGQKGTNNSPIRSVSSQDPNYGTDNPALTCGPKSKAGNKVTEVQPGDEMSFEWKDSGGGLWPHNIGPILTYMASCGDQECNNIDDPADLKWFKTEQVGRKPNSAEWVQSDVKDGAASTATVPANLAPGNYMVRHEIIALHIATTIRQAEFYPGCVAVRVTGTGTGVPKDSDLVSFPGAYKDDDPGIFTPNIFDSNVKYIFPGPKVAKLAASAAAPPSAAGTAANNDAEVASPTPAADASTPATVVTPATAKPVERSTGSDAASGCAAPKPSADKRSVDQEEEMMRPRYYSRIMKRLYDAEVRASKPNAEMPSAASPIEAKGYEAIMVPRRYSRVMKRLVDELAKEGKLPPL